MHLAARLSFGLLGFAVVVAALDAAVRTFVLPRGVAVRLTRAVSGATRSAFRMVARRLEHYEARDRVMALYAPVNLLVLPAVLLTLVLVGFAGIFYALTADPLADVLRESGSALFTLGFAVPSEGTALVAVYFEAAIGLTLLALLISYLPTMYAAFSRREIAVSRLSVRAGTPPTAVELLDRAHRAGFTDRLPQLWEEWELWFVETEETHTSLSIVSFFRSPDPGRSWVTAAGTVLDAAALRLAAIDAPFEAAAGVCIRSGFIALRSIAASFDIAFDTDVDQSSAISVTRAEFDDALRRLEAAGIALKPDRDKCWRDFVGWRANYDTALLELAELVMAPSASWTSDRAAVAALRRRGHFRDGSRR